jgi:L-xylulokinase
VDAEGEPVREGILSIDSRHEEVAALLRGADLPKTIAVMRWLKEFEPESYRRTRWILGSKDWIRFKLTGIANADMTDTAAPADGESRRYLTECCDEAGVPECVSMLPPLKYSCELCGTLSEAAAAETGLKAGTRVVAGAHDMLACLAGTGCAEQGQLTVILGTLGINIAAVDGKTALPRSTRPGEWFVFSGIREGARAVTSSIGSGCNSLDMILESFLRDVAAEAERKGASLYSYANDLVAGLEPTSVIFQPYIMGTFYNKNAKAGFIGISSKTTRDELLLSVFQGICLSMCLEIRRLEGILGRFWDIWLVGGGAKSPVWCQMFADALNATVHASDEGEIGCRGAALCAGIALGYLKEIGPPGNRRDYTPSPDRHSLYARQMELYRESYDACMGIWEKLDR